MRLQALCGASILLFDARFARGSAPTADAFCQEATGNPQSYCKEYQTPPTCHGSSIECSASARENGGVHRPPQRTVSAGSVPDGNPWDSITVAQRDRHCQQVSNPASYCKVKPNSEASVCHGSSTSDCSKRAVFESLQISAGRTTTPRPTTTAARTTTTVRPATTTRAGASTTRAAATTTRGAATSTRAAATTTRASATTTRAAATTTVAGTTTVAVDPCGLRDATLLGRSPVSGDSYFMNLDSLRACVLNTKISHANAIWTLHNLHFGVTETYSFTDIVTNSAAALETNTCRYTLHGVRVDLQASILSQIAAYNAVLSPKSTSEINAYLSEERPAYEFHVALMRMMNQLHDAHTLYTTPYDMFRVYFPVHFGSRMEAGRQVVTLRYSADPATPIGRLAYVHNRLFGHPPVAESYNGRIVTQINGVDALDFLKTLVGEEGVLAGNYQQMEQRLNAFIFSSQLLVLSLAGSPLPNFNSITLRFDDGTSSVINLLGQFADLSTSPYYSVPNLRSTAALSTYMHTNTAFNAFIRQEADYEEMKPTLWRHASAAAATPDMHARRMLASAGGDRWRQISKKHKALLNPINNKARDDILNVPLPVDPLDQPAIGRIVPAAILATVIDQTLALSNPPVLGATAFTQGSGMSWGIVGDTIVVKIPSMVPEARFNGDEDFYFFPSFIDAQAAAKAAGVTRVLFDLTDNGGGYVISAYALLWYTMADTSRICAPLRKRMTANWRQWIDSFGGGLSAIVDQHLVPQGDALAEQLDAVFREITSIVTLLYDGLGLTFDDLGSVTKDTALARIAAKKRTIAALATRTAKAAAIVQYIKSRDFVPNEAPVKGQMAPAVGFTPFDPYELTQLDTRKRAFSPLLSNYRNAELKNWGRPANYSLPGEYSFCYDVMQQMPSVARGYEAGYWRQVSFVTDGTCGSACALFTQGIQTNGDAVAFTYGGLADTAMDVASFAGGNVEEYDAFWPSLAFAAKLGHLASGGRDAWSTAHARSWVASPIAFPTRAGARFNWNMMFVEAMGENALPRQFYLIPARRHVNLWASDDAEREQVYAHIAAIRDWAGIPAQFAATHGQCPLEVDPFTVRQRSRVF